MNKQEVLQILNEVIDLAMQSKGVDDDVEFTGKIIGMEEYIIKNLA